MYISGELIWGTLLQYADQFRLAGELEAALVIACSLRENRYMAKVTLPKVVSTCDLVYPRLSRFKDGVTDKTQISLDASKMLGRVHQMFSFLLFKDLDTSMSNISLGKGFHNRDMRHLDSRDLLPLMEYMEDKLVADILKVTGAMTWLSGLTDRRMEALCSISVFEAFWLIDYPRRVFEDGVIWCFKHGYKNPIGIMQPGLYFYSKLTTYIL